MSPCPACGEKSSSNNLIHAPHVECIDDLEKSYLFITPRTHVHFSLRDEFEEVFRHDPDILVYADTEDLLAVISGYVAPNQMVDVTKVNPESIARSEAFDKDEIWSIRISKEGLEKTFNGELPDSENIWKI